MKSKYSFWGFYFLLASIGVVVNQLGYFGTINIVTLLFTILLIPIIIKSIEHVNFTGILIPLAIILILYEEPLGITTLTPWPILIAAVCASIGLSLLFKRPTFAYHHKEHFNTIIDEDDENVVSVSVRMSSSIKYVNSKNLEKSIIQCSCGALKVYFDNATISEKGAEINLDISLSGVELYIPKTWNIVNKISTSLGGLEEKNKNSASEGPVVLLTGYVELSGVEIIYV